MFREINLILWSNDLRLPIDDMPVKFLLYSDVFLSVRDCVNPSCGLEYLPYRLFLKVHRPRPTIGDHKSPGL